MNTRIVIVGAGHAAIRFCEEMRGLGFDGSLILVGEEWRRPYERPPLSKTILCGHAEPADHGLLAPEREATLAVEWRGGCRTTAIDRAGRRVILEDGATIAYDKLVIATGVTPRRLDCPGSELSGLYMLGDADNALSLREALAVVRQRIVIVGGGFIGLEVAAAARQQGHDVAVVEGADRCAGRLFPPSLSGELTDLHRHHGVAIITGAGVAEIIGTGRATAVRLASGGILPADQVVVGIGSRPRTELAEDCGLAVGNGIFVDALGRTSDPAIFAIGDVAMVKEPSDVPPLRRESWDNAQTTAQRTAAAIMEAKQPDPAPPWFWTDQYDCNIQFIGECAQDCVVLATERDGGGRVYLYAEQDRLVAAGLVNAGRDRRRLMKAVGSHEPVNDVAAMLGGLPLRLAS